MVNISLPKKLYNLLLLFLLLLTTLYTPVHTVPFPMYPV